MCDRWHTAGPVCLQRGKWRAVVLTGFGMNPVLLRCQSQPVLREPADLDMLKQSPFLYGMPLLFPPNRTRDGKFAFDGVEYSLPINEPEWRNHLHGQYYDAPFQVIAQDRCSLSAQYRSIGKRFPFPFVLTIADRLEEEGFFRRIELCNTGRRDMPVLLGFHTTFAEPDVFSVPIGGRWETDRRYLPTGRIVSLTPEQAAFRTGCNPHGKKINGFYQSVGGTAKVGDFWYQVSPEFQQWVLFNGDGNQSFLCIEPQTGVVNGLNMPGGYIRLAAGESFFASMSITR